MGGGAVILSSEERAPFLDEVRANAGWFRTPSEVKRAMLGEILSTVESDAFPGAVIPRMVRNPKRMVYYAVANDEREWRMLAGLLRSFVGATLTDYQGIRAELNLDDPFEALLAAHIPGRPVARFTPGGHRDLERSAVDALLRMVRLVERERRVKRTRPRSTREVLRDFRLALAGGNDQAAGEALDFLRQNLRLDAINLYFLEVERRKARRDWEALARADFFVDLAQRRRPSGVTDAMVEALYHTVLAPLVESGDLAQVRDAFEALIRAPYPRLLLSLPPNPSPATALVFLLDAYAQRAPDAPAVAVIRDLEPRLSDPQRALAVQILAALSPEPPPGPEPGATLPATAKEAFQVVQQAYEASSLSAYKHALDCVNALPEAEQEIFMASKLYRMAWENLRAELGAAEVPTSWPQMIEMLPGLTYAQLRAVAQRAQDEWPVGEHLPNPEAVAALREDVQLALCGDQRDKAVDLLPYIVRWVTQDPLWPNPAYISLYEGLLDCLLLLDQHAGPLLDAISTLTYGCLSVGLARAAYTRMVGDLGDRAQEIAAVETADWLLDLGEQFLTHPCPDAEVRANFWVRVQERLRPVFARLRPDQRALLVNISEAMELPFAASDELAAAAEEAAPFDGTIAVYTLQQGVANRVREVLQASHPELRVEICTDRVATARVRHLARAADYFVICWQDAKHAVTRAVSQLRPENKAPIVWAPGGGSAGVLRAIRECVARASGGRSGDSAA